MSLVTCHSSLVTPFCHPLTIDHCLLFTSLLSSPIYPWLFILHPSSLILHPSSFIPHPSSLILQPFNPIANPGRIRYYDRCCSPDNTSFTPGPVQQLMSEYFSDGVYFIRKKIRGICFFFVFVFSVFFVVNKQFCSCNLIC
jgi:hypothetical protein